MPKIYRTHKRRCLWIRLKHLILQECLKFRQKIMNRRGLGRTWRQRQCKVPPSRWYHQPQRHLQHHYRKIDSSLQRLRRINTSPCQMNSRPPQKTSPQRVARCLIARATWRRAMITEIVAIHHLTLDLQQWSHVSRWEFFFHSSKAFPVEHYHRQLEKL